MGKSRTNQAFGLTQCDAQNNCRYGRQRRCLIGGLLALIAVLFGKPAAADDYIIPNDLAIVQTLIRFGALDLNNDVVIDDYAKIAECDLYRIFHRDDFKWQKIREGLRQKIRSEAITYPTTYMVNGIISLDRYDFKTKMFLVNPNSPILGINSFRLMERNDTYCQGAFIKILPEDYVAAIDTLVNVPGFVMSEDDAQALLTRLTRAGNAARQIYARFNLRITNVPPVRIDSSNLNLWYDQMTFVGKKKELLMDAKLDSVEFYEEPEMKRRLYLSRQ